MRRRLACSYPNLAQSDGNEETTTMDLKIHPRLLAITLSGLLMLMTGIARAQDDPGAADPAASTSDPEIAALEREKKIATLKKEVAQARRDAFLANLPASEAGGATRTTPA